MHALLFGMKRAFQASLRVMRRPLQPFGLTAARFDMLWCIHQSDSDDEAYPLFQSEVRKRLGVTAATVTRMMQSLEALGLVRRERAFVDRRQIVVSLTDEGLARVLTAYAHFVERKAAERVIASALPDDRRFDDRRFDDRRADDRSPDDRRFDDPRIDERPLEGRRSDEQAASRAMGRFEELLDRIRKGFGDRADLHYRRQRNDPGGWFTGQRWADF